MAKSDARFDYRANLARDSHDLSRKFGFSVAPGMLVPIFADIATPGDAYYISHDLTFLRTGPLAAPAMVDVKVHFESFFVPMQMIYQPFENTIFSLSNLQSSFYSSPNLRNNSFPTFNYGSYVTNIMTSYARASIHQDAFRLADMLELNADNFAQTSNQPPRFSFAPSFFPWQLLTYHTIFQYYYRLDDKSQFDNQCCNWDNLYDVAQPSGGSITKMMEIHQRPWNFDYFTSLYRSPIVSDANLQSVLSFGSYSNLVSVSTGTVTNNGSATTVNSNIRAFSASPTTSPSQNSIQNALSSASLRQMFANEKLAMISGRARKTYDSQVLAHFGVSVPHDVKHDLSLIGSDVYPLHIGEVTSLAQTYDSTSGSGSALGDLAGKGWSQGQGHQHKFVAPCHGVVMTIFSIEPEQRYFGSFNRINSVTNAFDIPTPEFDRLGNVPMYRYETGYTTSGGSTSDVVGWKERYYWNKRRADKTTLGFQISTRRYATNDWATYMIARLPYMDGATNVITSQSRPDLESSFYIPRDAVDNSQFHQ